MRLRKLKLHNFRCFGPRETEIGFNDFSALIGGNSTGKTTVLQALLKLFGTSPEDRELHRSDFHVPPGTSPDSMEKASLYIEAVLVFPELADSDSGRSNLAIPPFFNQMVVSEPGKEPYVRVRLTAEWTRSTTPEGDIEARLEFILAPEEQEFTDSTPTTRVLGYQRSQVQVIYVPAIRDPGVHLRSHSSSILWRLLRAVEWPDVFREEVEDRVAEINQMFFSESGVSAIRKGLQDQWSAFHDDDRYAQADIRFNSTELEDILKKVQVGFQPTPDGTSYEINQLGDGLRSLFYLSLVSMLLDIEDKVAAGKDLGISKDAIMSPALTILALEEPENHLSPHLLGKVVQNCYQIARLTSAQVIITSHTPALLRRVNPEDIRHLRIDGGTQSAVVSQVRLPPDKDEAHKYVKEAVQAYPEIYFSKVVVLGEGDSEEIVLSRAIEASGYGLDRSQVSVVPLGGRYVSHFWRLLNDLKIPHVTLLDLDRERPGGGWGRIQYVIKELLKIGVPKNELLTITRDGSRHVLSDSQLNKMGSWDVKEVELMEIWVAHLKEYGVFFSSPLDLDFMMLSAFPDEYMRSYEGGRGPMIPDGSEEEAKRLERAIVSVLKQPSGQTHTYSPKEIELFPWYTYLFLGRGKPTTHIAALRFLGDEELCRRLPDPLRRLIEDISKKIGKSRSVTHEKNSP